MNENLLSPKETFERLLGGAKDSRRKRSLEALNEVCRLLVERGVKDLSYRSIITLGQDRGMTLPSEKSMMNPTGEHYRELINAWRLSVSEYKESQKVTPQSWCDSIVDPVLRLSVAMLNKELLAAKAKIHRMESFQSGPIYLTSPPGETQAAYHRLKLDEVEISALKAAIDPKILTPLGMSIGARGEVVDSRGRMLHRPGFVDAIEKIIALESR